MNLQRIAAVLLLLAAANASCEELQHELLVFGSGELVRASDIDPPAEDISDEELAADVLFSVQRGPFRLFGEYLLSTRERDLERFQIGWEPSENMVVWLGRFHQASSFWNHEHHHGQYLQTSITRPAVEEWEDEGGFIPQHFVGLLVESSWHLPNGHGLRAAFGGGLAPVVTEEGLEPLDLTNPSAHDHRLGFQARLAYLPDELGDSGVGVLLAHNELNSADDALVGTVSFDHVDQSVAGLYASLRKGDWRLFGAGYYTQATLKGTAAPSSEDGFFTGYVQAEWDLSGALGLFARHEDSAQTRDVAYLELFPNFVLSRSSLGLRWAIARRHALSFQISDTRTTLDDYGEIRIQWSAALL